MKPQNKVWIVRNDSTGIIYGVFYNQQLALECLVKASGSKEMKAYSPSVYTSKASNGVEIKASIFPIKEE